MAIYHIKPLTGNDANSGLTEALAKQSYENLIEGVLLVTGDTVILYNESNTEHVITFDWAGNVTIPRHFLTIQPALDSDGNFVTLRARRNINNSNSYQVAGLVCNRVVVIQDLNNINGSNCFRSQSLSGGGWTFLNCITRAVNNPTANSSTVWSGVFYKGSSGQGQAWRTEIDGTGNAPLSMSTGYQFQQCNIHDHSNTTASSGNYPINAAAEVSFIRCRFWNLTAPAQSGVSTSSNRRAYINFTGGSGIFIQNTVLCNQNNVAMIALGLDNTANTKSYQIYNNIFWSTVTAVSSYVFLTDATTVGYEQDLSSFIGFNFHNLIGENISGVTGLGYRAGANVTITTNPFLSTTIGDANFLKLDPTLTECPGDGLAGSSPGFLEVTVGGGALLPVGDVKIGVDRGDGSLGTYDGSDRWTVPSQDNVKFGVAYKENSLTNNRTGNRTDAVASNVRTGSETYGANGTEFTPSYSPDFPAASSVLENDTTDGAAGTIPLSAVKTTSGGTLPLTKIAPSEGGSYNGSETNDAITASELKMGVTKINLGNTVNGTYDAIERYSDLDLSQIVSGYAYRYNSLSNNRTGTRTSIYPVLSASNVKFNIDRGDGVLGTDKGADFNTALTSGLIKVGESVQSLGNTVNGTYDAIERYTDPDLSKIESTYSFRYNSLTNNRTGTRIFYPLLSIANVKIDVDRGDGQLGTYVASERYSDPGVDKVKHGTSYKFNSLTNNRSGELYLPSPADVRDGVLFGHSLGDEGTLVLPTEAQVKIGVLFDDMIREGNYTGSERYTDVDDNKVISGYNYRYNSLTNNRSGNYIEVVENDVRKDVEYGIDKVGNIIIPSASDVKDGVVYDIATTGSLLIYSLLDPSNIREGVDRGDGVLGLIKIPLPADVKEFVLYDINTYGTLSTSADYPSVEFVLAGKVYANGTLVGTLGQINENDLDIVKQINDDCKNAIASSLGQDYKELKFIKNLETNDSRSLTKRYGIRPTTDTKTTDLIANGVHAIDVEYEVVLTDTFLNVSSDQPERDCEQRLITEMNRIRNTLYATAGGFNEAVRIVKEFDRSECERVNDKTLSCRATFIINYRTDYK